MRFFHCFGRCADVLRQMCLCDGVASQRDVEILESVNSAECKRACMPIAIFKFLLARMFSMTVIISALASYTIPD